MRGYSEVMAVQPVMTAEELIGGHRRRCPILTVRRTILDV